jgi:ribosomal protein L7/L12
MNTEEILLCVAIALAAILLFGRGGKSADAQKLKEVERKLDVLIEKSGAKVDPPAGLPPGVAEALAKGDKIEAIKQYRAGTGAGLKEAKDFVEALPYADIERKTDALMKKTGTKYDPACEPPPGVMEALSANNVIEAIKLYREATGLGLKESKEAVEALQRKTVH